LFVVLHFQIHHAPAGTLARLAHQPASCRCRVSEKESDALKTVHRKREAAKPGKFDLAKLHNCCKNLMLQKMRYALGGQARGDIILVCGVLRLRVGRHKGRQTPERQF